MTPPGKRAAARRPQAGFSLVELLVSMTLGLVVTGALTVMYLSGGQAARNVEAHGRMNDDAQMALAAITHELRQAGYNPVRDASGKKNDLGQKGWSLFACDTGFTGTTAAKRDIDTLRCDTAGANLSVAVVYEADLNTGRNTATTGLPMDCVGNGVKASPADAHFYTLQARFYVEDNALMCRGSGGGDSGNLGTAQALAENIESMTASFAVSNPADATNQDVRGYLTASGINNPAYPGLAALAPRDRWNKVVAVHICVVARSESPVLRDLGTAASYQDCHGNDVRISDGKLRRAYRSTVLLRNHGVGYS
ncbi:PilW family protein [Polaromonas sp. YR568]|uniref:PilW family protein n=1 Tax=Polaromonas sp. YR568 TaxID=1855301 RepID=UPI00398BEE68